MYKIAYLGDQKSLLMYKTAGISIHSPETREEVKHMIEKLKNDHCAIILISEQVYQLAEDVIQEYNTGFLPAITVLPAYAEEEQIGRNRMKQLIEQAVGVTY